MSKQRTISHEGLVSILRNQGVEAFNQARLEHDIGRSGLQYFVWTDPSAHLRGVIDSPEDWANMDFTTENLANVDFSRLRMKGTSFNQANLRGAKFCESNLESANFRGADIRNTDFREANVIGAYFENADIRGSNLVEVFRSQIMTRFDKMKVSRKQAKQLVGLFSESLDNEGWRF